MRIIGDKFAILQTLTQRVRSQSVKRLGALTSRPAKNNSVGVLTSGEKCINFALALQNKRKANETEIIEIFAIDKVVRDKERRPEAMRDGTKVSVKILETTDKSNKAKSIASPEKNVALPLKETEKRNKK